MGGLPVLAPMIDEGNDNRTRRAVLRLCQPHDACLSLFVAEWWRPCVNSALMHGRWTTRQKKTHIALSIPSLLPHWGLRAAFSVNTFGEVGLRKATDVVLNP